MYRVINLPIEPIERRYSIQWAQWFEEAFKRNNIPYTTVLGKQAPAPPPDKFLDPVGTFIWKFSQLSNAVGLCEGRDRYVIFLHDGWFPGIEAFPYIRDLTGADIRICSFWHAGAYDPTDLLGLRGCDDWAAGSEWSWFRMSDAVLTGSRYHAEKMVRNRKADLTRIEIVGYPIDHSLLSYGKQKKERLVVWPHRLSEDKCPEEFDRLSKEPCFTDVQFIKTLEVCKTKIEYYTLMSKAMVAVSNATHENFGISMVEAAVLGCYPVCPNRLSYPETMESICLYNDYDEMKEMVRKGLERLGPYNYPYANRYWQETVTDKICMTLKRLGEE